MSVMQPADHLRPVAGSAGHLLDPAVDVQLLPALQRAATERSSRPQRRTQGKHHRQRSSSEGRSEMITPEEFAVLPPSIQ